MARRPRVSQKEIDLAHTLSEAGLNANKIKGIVNRSHNTVLNMLKAKDVEDYKAIVHEIYMASKKKEASKANLSPSFGQETDSKPSIADFEYDDDDLVAWRKQVISQQNTIIACLKAIEYKL